METLLYNIDVLLAKGGLQAMGFDLFAVRLKEAREDNNLTTRELAEMVGVAASTISKYENRTHEPKLQIVQKLAEALNVNPVWLMGAHVDKYETNIPVEHYRIPVLGTIAAGQPIVAAEYIEGYEYSSEKADFCLRVKGDSMINARIYDGDVVFVRKQSDVDNGDIAVVLIDGYEATLKRVYKANGSVILQPENPEYKPIIFDKKSHKDIKILGKVIAVKFRL